MDTLKFGFIGCGNMGGSLARAVTRAVGGVNVTLSDISDVKAKVLADELNCKTDVTKEVARFSNFIFFGVKPQVMKSCLAEIAPVLRERRDRFVLVSMAAGVTIGEIKEMIGADYPVIRIMPNTPVSVGEGMILYTADKNVFMDELSAFIEAMRFAGKLDNLDEKLINAATAVSGCGPAFVCLFAEAMADAAVECGLPRNKAIEYAAQTLLGTAKLINKTKKHPAVLKDEVCSPAGSTVVGVHTLESGGFRGTVMSAVKSAFDKTNKL